MSILPFEDWNSIIRQAFCNCKSLKLVYLPVKSRLKQNKDIAFSVTMIETITIPASVEIISAAAFCVNINLSSVIFAEETLLKEIDRWSFAKASILSSVERIGFYAFGDCKKLSTVTFHCDSNLRFIGTDTFLFCTQLKYKFYPHFICLRNFLLNQFNIHWWKIMFCHANLIIVC